MKEPLPARLARTTKTLAACTSFKADSISIQALEEQLGTPLLQRSQKRVSRTAPGEVYYDFARRILEVQEQAEESIADLQNKAKGWIRFSAPEIYSHHFFPAQLARLAREFPDVQLDVLCTDVLVDPIQQQLDFSLRGAYPASSDLIGYPLWEYDRILCAAPAYVEKFGMPTEPERRSPFPKTSGSRDGETIKLVIATTIVGLQPSQSLTFRPPFTAKGNKGTHRPVICERSSRRQS